ncbi:nucleotide-binding universal stress UspA family protein [Variovorax paradoxus]|uniref:universal stress protein n=1 Tax=Variovorax paradoxus TaxID=34073 RepID=UPI00278CBC32|nr:universal stress protein [Variovorax paradoxus]MDQ0570645.1 nucleotide-binding universal stress UspA family protein [Variovorax paradoxus]
MRRRILVPIDPTEPARTRSAVDQVVRICQREPAAVRLLRVQPAVSGHVAMFFDAQELRELQQSTGAEELQFAQNLLAVAGISCTTTVAIGRSAETIVAAARDFGCDRIVFGRDEPSLAGRIFGSLAQQVRQLLGASGDHQVIGS